MTISPPLLVSNAVPLSRALFPDQSYRGCCRGSSDLCEPEAFYPVHYQSQYTGSHSSAALYVSAAESIVLCELTPLSDVVVPIPLPLSAILILVIGELFPLCHEGTSMID